VLITSFHFRGGKLTLTCWLNYEVSVSAVYGSLVWDGLRKGNSESGGMIQRFLFSYVSTLLSSRFTTNALVWFNNFLKYLVFHFLI
jgi:hypothetical protein